MRIVCANCNNEIEQRLTANCPRCIARLAREGGVAAAAQEERNTTITKVAMRVARYNASETYYPQSVTILRLDRPDLTSGPDPALDAIESMLPRSLRRNSETGTPEDFIALAQRLASAQAAGNEDLVAEIRKRIALLAESPAGDAVSPEPDAENESTSLLPDVTKGVRESVALRTTVHSRSALEVADEGGGATGLLLESVNLSLKRLGFAEALIVDDLPVISSTYGYTRRSFEPTYAELSAEALPTEIRVFPSLDEYAARRLARPDLAGTVPIPAREGEHEGLYLSLEPLRLVEWLRANGCSLEGDTPEEIIPNVLQGLEEIDKYYDRIWECPNRRLAFGLVHTISHVAMRAVARFAGMQRTSLSEYLFLPLLGTVIYDNATEFQLGGLRTMARDHLSAFFDALAEEATKCLYDPDCLDHLGACHGCVHSPEICCRVFNHGLSRSFLVGGHAPWADIASEERIVGYWEFDQD